MDKKQLEQWKGELEKHLSKELIPFWTSRCWDKVNGGYLTQWDQDGALDAGCDEKSMLAHMRMLYALTLVCQYGHDSDGKCSAYARKGFEFAIDRYWDPVYGGFYWLFDKKNQVVNDKKIVYGQSFAIYALSTYAKVFRDARALSYAEETFDLLQKYAAETSWGGYWEMFSRDWKLCGPGPEGGDRKTLDVHMHLMEAFTALYKASGKEIHRRKLVELMDLIMERLLDKKTRTGTPQFYKDWTVAPQIKFNVIWGKDRFDKNGQKPHADNSCYGHNVEMFWLMKDALDTLAVPYAQYDSTWRTILADAVDHGIDWKYGGVFVEGAADGHAVYDMAKEFWQQAELMNGMLDAYIVYHDERFLKAYAAVHRFVMDKVINHKVGEWLPLLTREGEPIWRYMSNSWKINYHTVRCTVLCIDRLSRMLAVSE